MTLWIGFRRGAKREFGRLDGTTITPRPVLVYGIEELSGFGARSYSAATFAVSRGVNSPSPVGSIFSVRSWWSASEGR